MQFYLYLPVALALAILFTGCTKAVTHPEASATVADARRTPPSKLVETETATSADIPAPAVTARLFSSAARGVE